MERIFQIPSDKRDAVVSNLAGFVLKYLPGKQLRVSVDRITNRRTNQQNRALWGCAYRALSDQTGNDMEDLHLYFCGEYFGWNNVLVMNQRRHKPIRTTTHNEHGERDVISTIELAAFYAFVQQRSAQLGYDIPDPDPEWTQEKSK